MARFRTLRTLGLLGGITTLAAFAALGGGCATVSGGDGEFSGIVKDRTPLSSGPGQMVPDSYLEAGTRIRVIGHSGDYVRVQTVSGETGLVPASSIGESPDRAQ
jgi:hypothetical protein